jgi:hypothetical protein
MKKEQSSRKKTDQNFWATEKILVLRHESKPRILLYQGSKKQKVHAKNENGN